MGAGQAHGAPEAIGPQRTACDHRVPFTAATFVIMQSIENQFRAALAFAYTFVIARLFTAAATGHDINVIAVIATYLLLGGVAVVLRRSMQPSTDVKVVRGMTFATLGAFAATAPEFW